MVAKVLALRDYYKVNFSTANGIAFAGGAIGMIVFAPIMELGIQKYGWRGAMFLFGALNLNMTVAGCLMIKPNTVTEHCEELEDTNDYKRKEFETTTDQSAFFSRWFAAMCNYLGFSLFSDSPLITVYLSAFSLHALVIAGWMVFLVSYSISLGFSNEQASFLSSISGIGALAGRILHAPFVDNGILSGKAMFCIFAIGGTLSVACYPLTDYYWVLSIISFHTGLFMSAAPPIFIVILHELFLNDTDRFSRAVGLHYMARGIGRLVGGPLTGNTIIITLVSTIEGGVIPYLFVPQPQFQTKLWIFFP